jgi:hypothetical protein
MTPTASWTQVLFLYKRGKLSRSDTTTKACGFHVGIWWHSNQRLVAFLQSIREIGTATQLVDSDLTHDSAWDTARRELHCPTTAEYFEIPRGRILWDPVHRAGILYHGNSTPEMVFKKLASLYGFPRWEARLDEHYLTGEALEEFYRLE